MNDSEYDYIIVGSGSAGCIVANRLSADPQKRVLLLETGLKRRNFWLRLPVGYFRTMFDERFSRVFDTEPEPSTGNRNILWPRGRLVGGSSGINGLIFIRGQQQDFQDWESLGARGWNYHDVLPFFKRIESWQQGNDDYRGGAGELGVSALRQQHPHCQAWLRAAQDYGLPANPDYNGAASDGVYEYQLSIKGRWRCSADIAFLEPAIQRGNLDIITDAHATRVLFNQKKATGVEWLHNGQTRQTSAKAEVILCAGAIQSPQLLQHSGIGPADVLQANGIEVLVNSSDVGQHLQDHYQIRLMLQMQDQLSLNRQVRNPIKLMTMGYQWLCHAKGALTVGAGQVGGSACTAFAQQGRPDIQFNVMPLSVDKPGTPLHKWPGFTTSFWQCHPHSRGSISLGSPDPLSAPRIIPGYLSDERDRQVMLDGVRIARAIHQQNSFRHLWNKEVLPGDDCTTDESIANVISEQGGTVFHPCGTCRMGSDERSVVDPLLRVRGVTGLRVIDASVMPKITSANINAPTLMLAEKGAHHVIHHTESALT